MIAALCLALAADVRATLAIEPERAQVGEPVTLTLVVEHEAGLAVTLPELAESVRGSWMVTEALGVRRQADPARPGTVVETARWSAFALEGGAAPPPVEVTWKEGEAEARAQASFAGAVEVAPALAAGEDAPRPSKGFREPVDWTGGGPRLARIALGVAALLVLALAWRLARRARRRAVVAVPTAQERLAALEARARAEPERVRDVLYDLTGLVRAAVDAHVGAARSAATDAEWLRALAAEPRVPETARGAAQHVLERAERVKYAAEVPTRFAVDELVADTRALLEALDAARAAERRAA